MKVPRSAYFEASLIRPPVGVSSPVSAKTIRNVPPLPPPRGVALAGPLEEVSSRKSSRNMPSLYRKYSLIEAPL